MGVSDAVDVAVAERDGVNERVPVAVSVEVMQAETAISPSLHILPFGGHPPTVTID